MRIDVFATCTYMFKMMSINTGMATIGNTRAEGENALPLPNGINISEDTLKQEMKS